MTLTVTAGSTSADSYATVAEADAYMTARGGFQTGTLPAEWTALSTAQKEMRLRLAASLMDSLMFRGIKATRAQSLAFPRLFRGDDLWPEDVNGNPSDALADQYDDWTAITEAATDEDVDLPTVPQAVKDAQVETAFQVIHLMLSKQDAAESAVQEAGSLTIGKLSINLGSSSNSSAEGVSSIFRSGSFDSQVLILMLLRPYITRVRGAVI